MGNLAAAFAATATVKGPRCAFAGILPELDDEDAQALAGWLADPAVQHAHLARTLNAIGYKVASGTVARHRRGECECPTP